MKPTTTFATTILGYPRIQKGVEMPKRRDEGSYEVSGPNLEARSARSEGQALSLAQNFASHYANGEGVWYVRCQGVVVFRIYRTQSRVVLTETVSA
jgi:hypothetical protein